MGEPACLKLILLSAVMSVNVTGEGACGPAGGGFFGNSPTLYERPARGVGVGGACCPTTGAEAAESNKINTTNDEKFAEITRSRRRLSLLPFLSRLTLLVLLITWIPLCPINQFIIPFVRNPPIAIKLRRILMSSMTVLQFPFTSFTCHAGVVIIFPACDAATLSLDQA